MTQQPHVREAGQGPALVCLHSNAAHGGQWRALMEQLAPAWHVMAPDSWGSGKSPEWPSDRVITLADEVALLAPVLGAAGAGAVLAGHSYGAAVALKAALAGPRAFRALVLYEPTLFSLIEADGPAPNDADGIRTTAAAAGAALDAGDRAGAARLFIDYWMGPGAYDAMPPERRAPVADAVVNVRRWWHALSTEATPLAQFAALDMPVLYLLGERTTAAARGVARRLAPVLPQVRYLELPGLGHMGPVTHPAAVNQAIGEFLARLG